MRHKLKSEPGIDEKKLSWTFSIVLFWQDVYSLSPCGPVRGFRRFRWGGRLLQTSHFYTPVGDVTNNVDGCATSTIPEGQALRKKYLILTVTYKNKLWRDVNGDKMNLLYMAESVWKWRLTQESLLHQGEVYDASAESEEKKRLISFSYVFLCHSAAMLKVRYWFNWNPSWQRSAIQPHSELWVCACCCSLFIAGIGRTLFHTFRTLPGPLLGFFFFFLSLPPFLPFCISSVHSLMHDRVRTREMKR